MAFEAVGTTITFASSFLAEITSIGLEESREQINVSHFGSTDYHEYIPAKLQEPGELTCTIFFDPSTAPPIGDAPENCTITWSDSGAGAWAGTAFMISHSVSSGIGEAATQDVTIKFTGAIQVS